jgi:hypothetical protein
VRADAVLLLGTPIKVVVHDVGHNFTSGGSGSGIQWVTSAHHSQLPLMYSLSNTSVPSVAKTRTSSSGSRSATGIHSPIASSRCVTQKQTQNVSFLMHFRYQKNRPCRKVAFAVCELRPECHVFWQKNLPSEVEGTSRNDLIYGNVSGCGSNAKASAIGTTSTAGQQDRLVGRRTHMASEVVHPARYAVRMHGGERQLALSVSGDRTLARQSGLPMLGVQLREPLGKLRAEQQSRVRSPIRR